MELKTLEPIIAAHPFFQGLTPAHLALIVGCASNVRFNAGEFVAHQENEANTFYLIRYGHISVELYVPNRGGAVAIQTLGPGDVLGWSWLFPPYTWQFDARAVNLTRAIAFDGHCLRTKCDENYELGYEVMKRFAGLFSQRLSATRLQLLDMYG